MAITVDEIQSRLAAIIDQDENTSNISTTDYSLRRRYINMAQQEWAEAHDAWPTLYKEYNLLVSTSTGNATIDLPGDFRKLASYPVITYDGTNTSAFPEVRPQEKRQYAGTDKFVSIYGGPDSGYKMFVHNATLGSGASVFIPYYACAPSLISPANISPCPDPDYLFKRALSLIWEGQDDQRFPQAKAEAEKILMRMLANEQTHTEAASHSRVKTMEETKKSFRWGRD